VPTHGLWQRDLALGDRSGNVRAVAAQQRHSPAVEDGYAALPVEFASPAKSVNRSGGWPNGEHGLDGSGVKGRARVRNRATVSGATLAS